MAAPESWLPLTEYSSKHKVSLSTLRRRIKNGEIEYRFDDGKYFLKDSPIARQQRVSPPPVIRSPRNEGPTNRSTARVAVAPPQPALGHPAFSEIQNLDIQESQPSPVLVTANKLLEELKKAYMTILQEKEEQILQLKEELTDLKTLVRVLEGENERMKGNAGESAPIDSWLTTFEK